MESNTFNSIDGATALKLDESYELEEKDDAFNEVENSLNNENLVRSKAENNFHSEKIPSGELISVA